jgi:predicted ATPase/DNA-binding SARP family transcriptional activator
MDILALEFLGKSRLTRQTPDGGRQEIELQTNKAMALLCYLAVTAQPHTRHALAGLFWPEDAEENAKNSLRVALSSLTRHLGEYIEANRIDISFRTASPHLLDCRQFERALAEALRAKTPDITALQQALALYRGEFLADFYVEGAAEFEEWVLAAREHWRRLATDGFTHLSDALLDRRDYAQAAAALNRLLALEPWNEEAHRRLMIAYSRMGDFNAALAQYQTCVRRLRQELEVPPMPETEALRERIQAARAGRKSNLPMEETPFLGRSAELDRIHTLLLRPDCRLITLTGFGGMGKTRTAIAAASLANREQAIHFINGVLFVSLAAVASADHIPLEIAKALGLSLAARAAPAVQLVDFLRNQELLLVLDNYEHLLDGVGLLDQILRRCPHVKLLATSREPLGLAAEWRIDLAGMAFPDEHRAQTPATLLDYDAVRLFVQTAQQIVPLFQLQEQYTEPLLRLCALTGGSPLAIKMATLWLRVMPIERIVAAIESNMDLLAAEMRDWPQRQRSMRAIFDYTYASLGHAEQSAFRRIAVFRGGCTAEAAAAVAGASPAILAGLVDRGLLQARKTATTARFTVHELTRQYAASRLSQSEEYDSALAHCNYFMSLVSAQRQRICRGGFRAATGAIGADLDNIRAAWQWAASTLRSGGRLDELAGWTEEAAWALQAYFESTIVNQIGRRLFEDIVSAMEAQHWDAPAPQDPLALPKQLALARCRICLAQIQHRMGEYELVQRMLLPLLPQLRQAPDLASLADAITELGRNNFRRGRRDEAEALLREGMALYEQLGDAYGVGQALLLLGLLPTDTGDYDLARQLTVRAFQIFEELEFAPGMARALSNIGTTYNRQQDPDHALPFYQKSLALAEESGDVHLTMIIISNIGNAYREKGLWRQAEAQFQRSIEMARASSDRRWIAANLHGLGRMYIQMNDLDAAAHSAQEGWQIARKIDNVPDSLGNLSHLSHVWARRGHVDRALQGLLLVERHPSATERDRRFNADLMQELIEELPAMTVAGAQTRAEQMSMPEIEDWVDRCLFEDAGVQSLLNRLPL